jgi:hypothetical protein
MAISQMDIENFRNAAGSSNFFHSCVFSGK